MVPDQLFMDGPNMYCEEGSQASVDIVESSSGMKEMNGQSIDLGRESSFDVEVGAPVQGVDVTAATTVGNTMMVGASRQEKEYQKSAKSGRSRVAFASVTAKVYTAALRDDSSLTGMFKDGIHEVEKYILLHIAAKAALTSANTTGATMGELDLPVGARSAATNSSIAFEQSARTELESELRMFTLKFGTDFITHSTLGGKVSQTTGTKSSKESNEDNEALTTNARANMAYVFYKANTQKTSMLNTLQKTDEETSSETFKEIFEGGIPSEDWHEWCRSTASAPVPVEYLTKEIADLVAVTMGKPLVAARLKAFLGERRLKMEACEAQGQGLTYDAQSGECKLGTEGLGCNSGQFTDTLKRDEYEGRVEMEKTAAGRTEYEKCFAVPTPSSCKRVALKDETYCRACPRGKYLGAGGNDICKSCAPGTFAETEGMSQCQTCPKGTDSNEEAQSCSFKKGDFWLTTVTNDGWEDQPGDADRKDRQICSMGQGSLEDGDGDIKEISGGNGWAYCDAKNTQHTVTLTHREGSEDDEYLIKMEDKGQTLSLTSEGDNDLGYGKYWAYFGTEAQYWKLVPAIPSGDIKMRQYFFLESTTYPGSYLGAADYDDGDSTRVCSKDTNCPWIVGGDRTHSGTCSYDRTPTGMCGGTLSCRGGAEEKMMMQKPQEDCANWMWKLESLSPAPPTRQPTDYDPEAPTAVPTTAPTLSCPSRNTGGTCGWWSSCDDSRGAKCDNDICICKPNQCAHDGSCIPLANYQRGVFRKTSQSSGIFG